jgi:BNR/Asp-box repeat
VKPRIRGRFAALFLALAVVVLVSYAAVAAATGGGGGSLQTKHQVASETKAAEGADEISEAADQYAASRLAPGVDVSADAFTTARTAAATLPLATGTAWSELTNQPYDSDDSNFRDPFISNSGGGAGLSAGRMSALAIDPSNPAIVYAGAADGGVWKSTDRGAHWTPVFDNMGTLAIGAIAINPADRSVWVGTGENNTAFENYSGLGVFRSTDGGKTWSQVGQELRNHTIGKLEFDGVGGVYAATSFGLYKTSANARSDWTLVLDAAKAGFAPQPYGMSIVDDVVVQPGTAGQVVVAAMAWRNGAAYNGFYVSHDGGKTFAYDTLNGAINPKEIGNTHFAYSADGSTLYAVVQSTFLLQKPNVQSGNTVLDGVFVSRAGDPAGPWNQIADYRNLQHTGSALTGGNPGYAPGVQAWYNEFIGVDPADANHVYLGLEEVFETRDGGGSWSAIGPYWNFGLPCSANGLDSCPKTTHPDQHAIAIGGGLVYVGNDGGVYSRALSQSSATPAGWNNLNATLHTLQYYYAGAGRAVSTTNGHGAGGDQIWGGMQDNGGSMIAPGLANMVEPFGGDGGDTLVDPANGDRVLQEYVDLDIWKSTNGGFSPFGDRHAWTEITPTCFAFTYTPNPCDPNARFIAPYRADIKDVNHWVAGGQYVWDNQGKGWDTSCSSTACDWKPVYNTGSGNVVTALAASGKTIYAAWCGPNCNPRESAGTGSSAGFGRGLATNVGGLWHVLDASSLPNRYVNALVIDPADETHVYAVFGGFSRRWIPSAGVGHVFESHDGGQTWVDASGNLPDAPADDLVITPSGKLVLATDVGVFSTSIGSTAWSRLGTGLPNSSVTDLSFGPGNAYLIAATHGRGLWKLATP